MFVRNYSLFGSKASSQRPPGHPPSLRYTCRNRNRRLIGCAVPVSAKPNLCLTAMGWTTLGTALSLPRYLP